jgi:hypothetical protein
VVLPVAGLLAQAGCTLREHEYQTLAAVAALPTDDSTALLLTADRFAAHPSPSTATVEDRRQLLGRLGLFGVRLSTRLIRTGQAATATELAQRLVEESGVGELQSVVRSQFTARSRILKARSGLIVLRQVLASGGCRNRSVLEAGLERVEASAHELVEVRMLNAVRAGEIVVDADEADEVERLLGADGHEARNRLGLPANSDAAEVRSVALETLARWRRRSEHPMSSRQDRTLARVIARTMEGALADAFTSDPVG